MCVIMLLLLLLLLCVCVCVCVCTCVCRGHEWYTLVFVNRKAEQEPCHNEDVTLADVK